MEGLWRRFDRIVVFDTETTGIEPGKDRIIELGAVSLEAGAETGSLDALVRLPEGVRLSPFIVELTGITDEQLLAEGVDQREWDILQAVGVTDRRPAVEREREYIAAWVEMGVSDELIRLAYERTVYQKNAMNWPYMNKILQSWHQAGYRSQAQVEAEDRPAPRSKPAQAQPRDFQPSQERIQKNNDWLDQFLAQQKKEGG